MAMKMTRRKFLQTASLAAASVPLSRVVAQADSGLVRTVPTPPGSFVGTETRSSVCEMCFWRCQIVGKVRDGRLVKLEGNPKSVNNGKSICARGNAGVQLLYDPDRLKYPLKNVGERGKPVWKRISWQEALDECATRLMAVQKTYGKHALAVFPHGASAKYPMQFFEMTGTENVSEASFFQCRGIRDMGYVATFGFAPGENVDMAHAKAILLIGTHIGENVHVSHVKSYLKGLAGGAKLIVVDPRFSASASKADVWVKIKPGTDTAFLLAIMNYLVRNNKYDREFVANNCEGFDVFQEGIAHATPEWAAGICDVPAAQIKEVAELLAASSPSVSVHPGRHVSWHGTDFQRMRAHACLTALLGAYAVPGGLIRPKSGIKLGKVGWPKGEHDEEFSLAGSHRFKPPGMPTDNIRRAMVEGKPYPIKACVCWGQNPIQTIPGQQRTIEALKKMEFVMVVDVMPTDITMYADILLPESSYLERYDFIKNGLAQWAPGKEEAVGYVAPRMPVVPAMFERRDQVWITNQLAIRMGYGNRIPVQSIEEMMDKMLAPAGLSLAKMQAMGGIHIQAAKPPYAPATTRVFDFPTDSGKIELFSEALEEAGFPAVPTFQPVPEVPGGYARLVYGRSPVHTFNRSQNNKWLHHEIPENPLWINEECGRKMGLRSGDRVALENQDGIRSRTDTVVMLTPGIRSDTVYMAHGYGSMNPALSVARGQGIDDQSLISRLAVDPETGAHGMRNNFVRMVKNGKVLSIPS